MIIRTLNTFILSLFICGFGFTQQKISGQIVSGEDGQSLPGATIRISGTSTGTISDFDGNYEIMATGSDILEISFIGFLSKQIAVGNQSVINVTLEIDLVSMEEVVVVGYGIVRKSDLTGAVSSIQGEDLLKIPTNSPMEALQGKVPGLQVMNVDGAPGSSPVVRIRGTGTFNNASPIYVVDGMILNDIDFLGSSDIQSIEILKDASSTAIYGSRGANGVVIITTKQGESNRGIPSVKMSTEFSMQNVQNRIDLLNGKEFATFVNKINPGSFNNVDAVDNTDWQDLIIDTAPIQNHQVSLSGSLDKMQYYFGVSYFKKEGILPKSNYERLSVKLNNTYKVTDNIQFGNNITISPYKQKNTRGNIVFVAYRAWPTITPFDDNGNYNEVPGVGNPIADLEYTNNQDKGLRGVGNFFGEYKFLNGFSFKTSFGTDLNFKKNVSYTPVFFVSPQQQNSVNDLNKSYEDRITWLWENTLSFFKLFDKHQIDAVVGYTMQEASSEVLNLKGENVIRNSPDLWYLNPNNINPNFTSNGVDLGYNFSMISYLFRVNYSYDSRYLFTATFRRDGSSKFIGDNRFANFPSFAIGWNIINENFLNEIPYLSNLKIRSSWGILGNEKISYDRIYSQVDNGVNAVFGTEDLLYPGASYGVSGNPNLRWEETTQTDIGLEYGFLDDRLFGEFDYYFRDTRDILIPLEVPGFLGNGDGATITYNAAEVLNKGLEFSLSWRDLLPNGIEYRAGIIGNTIHNEVLDVGGGGGPDDQLFGSGQLTRSYVGSSIGEFYGYQVDGIFQSQVELDAYPHLYDAGIGDVRFKDINNDGQLNDLDRTSIGSPIPDLIYGFNLGGSFKGIDLSIDFQGQIGNEILNYKETVRPDRYNFEKHFLNGWNGEGTSKNEPRASEGGVNFRVSSRYIQDGSFFRLRNITIGYTLPSEISGKINIKSSRIFLRGTNLFTSTKFTGYSPEIASHNPVDNGIDRGTYPLPSVYSLGINMSF